MDDATGPETEIPLSAEVKALLQQNNLPLATPSRGANGKPGNSTTPGAKVPNTKQQYFADVTTKVILPMFKQRQKPFVLVYWSRDPDGTQHNQGDSLNTLTPGVVLNSSMNWNEVSIHTTPNSYLDSAKPSHRVLMVPQTEPHGRTWTKI